MKRIYLQIRTTIMVNVQVIKIIVNSIYYHFKNRYKNGHNE